jgi:UDP-N-acetylmuramoyl-L-alanyl-D-glutamate--2,6-diaminopimelate ligase
LGRFNVLNALAVIACLDCLGYEINNVKHGLENVNVPGRFQRIDSPSGFTVIVDYAHTNDALENVLTAIKNLGPKKIISVFGCGGDRDTGKRSLMGEISTRIADFTIITSDNPRTEDPEKIMDMIETGAKIGAGKYIRITDREKAIAHGISLACEGDIVLIAGKGHEDYQILGEKVIHFDDVETARKYV